MHQLPKRAINQHRVCTATSGDPAGCRPVTILLLVAWLMLTLPLLPAAAEPTENAESDLTPAVPEDFDPRRAGLASEPLVIESLGLAMYRPADSYVAIQRAGGQSIVTIQDSADVPEWNMTIQQIIATATEPTADAQIDAHLASLRATDRRFRVISNEPRSIGPFDGRLCFIEMLTDDEDTIVNGWLIVPTGHAHLAIFSIIALPEAFDGLRPVIERAIDTIRLRSAAEISTQRLSRIESGRALLNSINEDDLRGLVGTDVWFRIYRTGSGGEEHEIGYSRLQVTEAKRGELNPGRSEDQYGSDEHKKGFMVRVQGRVVGDVRREIYYDSLATYWMAWDQSEEAWSVRGTQRQREAERGESETGLRLPQTPGQPRPTLTVIHLTSGGVRDDFEWQVPDAYLSQPLGWLVGALLPTSLDEPLELAYYFYHNTQGNPQMTQRRDRWEPADDNSGNWLLTTRLTADAPPTVVTYSSRGELLRRERADGTVMEPATPEQIAQIWRRKGLEMESRGR